MAGGRKVVVRTDVFSRYVGAVEARSGFICLKVIMLLNIIRVRRYTFFPNNTTFLFIFSLLAVKTYLLSGSLAPKR